MKQIPVYEMKQKRSHHWDILIPIVMLLAAIAYIYFSPKAEAEVYIEDHSKTEAMIETLKPTIQPDLKARLASIIDTECASQGVPVELVVALIARESGFKVDAVSKKLGGNCSYGLMQINPGTAAHPRLLWQYSLYQLMEPEINIHEGVSILKACMDRSKSTAEALGRYCGSQGMTEYKLTILSNAVRLMSEA